MPTDRSTESGEFSVPLDRLSVFLLIGVGLLLLAKAFLAMNSAFEVDEFDLYARSAQFLDNPAGRLANPHRLLSVLLFSLGVVVGGSDPVIGMVINRAIAVVVVVAVYLLVMRIAGRLFGKFGAIHALVGLGMVFVFVDHSYTGRTDFVSLGLYLLALERLLVRRPMATWVAGIALALACLMSLKASLMVLSVLTALVAAVAMERSVRKGLLHGGLLAAGCAVPGGLYLVVRALLGADAPPGSAMALPQAAVALGADTGVQFSFFILSLLRQNPVFLGLALAGLAWTAVQWWRGEQRTVERLMVMAAVATYTVAVLSYSQPWPYFLATAVPGLAVFWGGLCGAVHSRLTDEKPTSVWVAALALLVVMGFARPADRVRFNLSMGNQYQVAIIDRLHNVVGPHDAYFDGVGMAPDLQRSTGLWLDVVNLQAMGRDTGSDQELQQRLIEASTAAWVVNWRTEQLSAGMLAFRDRFFVQDWGNIYTPGRAYETQRLHQHPDVLEVIIPGTYHVRGQSDEAAWRSLSIDGTPLTGPTLMLGPGAHTVESSGDVGIVRIQRYGEGFIEDRQRLDGYKALFPKEQYLIRQ